MRPLTSTQHRVLSYIIESIKERGIPPSYREISEHLGARSSAAASYHARALIAKGYLQDTQGNARGFRVVWEKAREEGLPYPVWYCDADGAAEDKQLKGKP